MGAYLIRPPKLYRWLYSDAIFRGPEDEKTVYLTFDDGPEPEATEFVLDVLKTHGVKGTFFFLGKNVLKHPETVQRLKVEGHVIANHGMNHLNGWKSNKSDYMNDALKGKKVTGSDMFRPPYGRLTLPQYWAVRKSEHVVFWDVISGDFDTSISPAQVIDNVVSNVRNGSIVVMHDSKKALKNLRDSLGQIIEDLVKRGYRFETLDTLIEHKNV